MVIGLIMIGLHAAHLNIRQTDHPPVSCYSKWRSQMADEREIIAYCGLYCSECPNHTGRIAERGTRIRIISCRKATPAERRQKRTTSYLSNRLTMSCYLNTTFLRASVANTIKPINVAIKSSSTKRMGQLRRGTLPYRKAPSFWPPMFTSISQIPSPPIAHYAA